MPSFIYSPGVQVFIQTSDANGNEGPTYDVSDDLVSGTLTRRTNGVSTFSFVLQNSGRKYDYDSVNKTPKPIFSPNDKIIVNMKRIKWMRVFTGYLNSVPIFQAWPGDISIDASCTLKRLQYYYWDPDSPSSQNLINTALLGGGGTTSDQGNSAGDAGLKNLAIALMTRVGQWDRRNIHISAIPKDWAVFATSALQALLSDLVNDNAVADAVMAAIGSAATINGSTSTGSVGDVDATGNATGTLTPGNFGGTTLTGEQLGNAETIYNVGVQKKASQRDIVMAIMCAMTESTLINVDHGDTAGPDSVGLFQQRDSWGTRAQRLTPSYAAGAFYDQLLAIGNRTQLSETQAIAKVQRPRADLVGAYQKWLPMATAVVNAIVNKTKSKNPTPTGPSAVGIPSQDAFLAKVTDLYENHKPVYKAFTGTSLAILADPDPEFLSATALISWAFVQSSGDATRPPPMTTPTALARFCNANSAHKMNESDGINTVGALMFVGKDEDRTTNVEVSLGNGHQTIAMTTTGVQLHTITAGTFGFSYGLPRVNYSQYAAGNGSTISTTAGGSTTTSTNNDWLPKGIPNPYQIKTDVTNAGDAIDQALLSYAWVPESNGGAVAFSAALSGRRALLNDQPLLPYLNNVLTSAQRSYCSAPNGDLMAWFPDYFGWYETAAKMHIQDIELQNFQMSWSDEQLVTHFFTNSAESSIFNVEDGSLSADVIDPTYTNTVGIASIEDQSIYSMMFAKEPTADEVKNFSDAFLKKFGARPQFQQLQGIAGPKGEFFMALYLFFQAWTYQFNADVPLTFMPEVWPGMILVLDSFGFQAYVTTVTHTFQFGDGGGFNTTVNLAAPSKIGSHGPLDFITNLPVGGQNLPKPSDFIPPVQEKPAAHGGTF